MALTSEDVNNQSFSIDRKGYNVDEVDVFLEQIASALDELHGEIDSLNNQLAIAKREAARPVAISESTGEITAADVAQRDARIRELEAQVADHRAEDSAIAQALIVAQRAADEIIANANGAAETTRQDATAEAQRILDKANAEKQRVLDQIAKLENDRENSRDQFVDMLSEFIANSQDILSDLQAGRGSRGRGSHTLPSARSIAMPTAAADYAPESVSPAAMAATYTTPTVSPIVVAPTTPRPAASEKDFSGFGDTDDGFELDDVD